MFETFRAAAITYLAGYYDENQYGHQVCVPNNTPAPGCQSWYDGCNNCMVNWIYTGKVFDEYNHPVPNEDFTLACTKRYCI